MKAHKLNGLHFVLSQKTVESLQLLLRAGEQVAHHMSVAVETGVWLTISGATYSGVPYLR